MADGSVTANPGSGGAAFAVDTDGSSHVWPYVKLAQGASGTQTEVSAANPLPVTDVVTEAAVGTPADAAWSGSGNSTIIAALKAIWTKLGSVVLAAGTAVIGKVGLQVSSADVSTSNPIPVVQTPTAFTPTLGDAHQVVTGGTAVSAFLANSITHGAYVYNPPSNTASIFVDMINAATTTAPPTNGTTNEILPGQRWDAPGPLTTAVSVNSASSTVSFTAVRW